jgi:hypothetical protein
VCTSKLNLGAWTFVTCMTQCGHHRQYMALQATSCRWLATSGLHTKQLHSYLSLLNTVTSPASSSLHTRI